MKRLISDKELRHELEEAFEAGYMECSTAIYPYEDGSRAPSFDEWYEGVYGGPDCE